MGTLARHFFHFLGIVLDIIGIGGVTGDVTQWTKWLAWATNWYAYIPLLLAGNALLAFIWALWISDHRIANHGGLSGREFPAYFHRWDKVNSIAVWQISWLWNGLEPQDGVTQGTPAYSTFQLLKQHLRSERIPDVQQHNGSWMGTQLDRQKLVNYALEIGEKPKFLFPKERASFIGRLVSSFGTRTYPFNDAKKHPLLSECRMHLIAARLADDEETDKQTVWDDQATAEIEKQIIGELENGQAKAIGRRKIGGLLWDYERIPRRNWRRLKVDYFNDATNGQKAFAEIRVLIEEQS